MFRDLAEKTERLRLEARFRGIGIRHNEFNLDGDDVSLRLDEVRLSQSFTGGTHDPDSLQRFSIVKMNGHELRPAVGAFDLKMSVVQTRDRLPFEDTSLRHPFVGVFSNEIAAPRDRLPDL